MAENKIWKWYRRHREAVGLIPPSMTCAQAKIKYIRLAEDLAINKTDDLGN